MHKVTPCLWFDGRAEEAVSFYTSVFKHAKKGTVTRYGQAGPGEPGSVMTISFEVEGQEFLALNGGPEFEFSPAVSFIIGCKTQQEIDELWGRFLDGGTALECGWITDRFGVTWQVVPTILLEMTQDRDAEKAKRVFEAMFKMVKLDIEALKRAYDGK